MIPEKIAFRRGNVWLVSAAATGSKLKEFRDPESLHVSL